MTEQILQIFNQGWSLAGEFCDGQHFTDGDNTISWFGFFKNGISMDFCKICANMNILNEVVVPYDGNDWGWPTPIKNQFQTILDKAKRVKRLHNGGFNPKKIKDMEAYINKMSDIVIDISVDSNEVKINLVTK